MTTKTATNKTETPTPSPPPPPQPSLFSVQISKEAFKGKGTRHENVSKVLLLETSWLGDGLPAIRYFINSTFIIISRLIFKLHQT
jgi:hypothetical protein